MISAFAFSVLTLVFSAGLLWYSVGGHRWLKERKLQNGIVVLTKPNLGPFVHECFKCRTTFQYMLGNLDAYSQVSCPTCASKLSHRQGRSE